MHTQPGASKVVYTHINAVATANGEVVNLAHPSDGHYPTVRVQVEGISGDTITFEGSNDGQTWYSVELTSQAASATKATTATADGIWWGFIPALVYFRTRLTRSAGTLNVTVCAGS
jgi:hypothetical protein